MGVPQNGWFTMENAIKMDDFWVPPFQETSILGVIPVSKWIITPIFSVNLAPT
jgi:hypothetical protein